jgi:hypothetical protein
MIPLEALNPSNYYRQLPTVPLLFSLVLLCVSMYCLVRLALILKRSQSEKRLLVSPNIDNATQTIRLVEHQLASFRQLLLFVFYLFAFTFFWGLPWAFIVGEGKAPTIFPILSALAVYSAYATDVCLVFLTLHTLQWIVSWRVSALCRGLH